MSLQVKMKSWQSHTCCLPNSFYRIYRPKKSKALRSLVQSPDTPSPQNSRVATRPLLRKAAPFPGQSEPRGEPTVPAEADLRGRDPPPSGRLNRERLWSRPRVWCLEGRRSSRHHRAASLGLSQGAEKREAGSWTPDRGLLQRGGASHHLFTALGLGDFSNLQVKSC